VLEWNHDRQIAKRSSEHLTRLKKRGEPPVSQPAAGFFSCAAPIALRQIVLASLKNNQGGAAGVADDPINAGLLLLAELQTSVLSTKNVLCFANGIVMDKGRTCHVRSSIVPQGHNATPSVTLKASSRAAGTRVRPPRRPIGVSCR